MEGDIIHSMEDVLIEKYGVNLVERSENRMVTDMWNWLQREVWFPANTLCSRKWWFVTGAHYIGSRAGINSASIVLLSHILCSYSEKIILRKFVIQPQRYFHWKSRLQPRSNHVSVSRHTERDSARFRRETLPTNFYLHTYESRTLWKARDIQVYVMIQHSKFWHLYIASGHMLRDEVLVNVVSLGLIWHCTPCTWLCTYFWSGVRHCWCYCPLLPTSPPSPQNDSHIIIVVVVVFAIVVIIIILLLSVGMLWRHRWC